jgi:acetyl-CoA acetyltransferase
MAGFGPARVDFAEVHDAFAPFELIALEDLGLVPPGKAGRATLDGETALDGRLPINPSGGLKARGHPLAATGIAQIVECVWQLTGRASSRQVPGRIALAHSIGGLATNNWVTLLEAVGPTHGGAGVSEPRAPRAAHPRSDPSTRHPVP